MTTRITDVVVPEIFTPYVQQLTEEKTRLIQSGMLVSSPILDGFLAGGGDTVKVPSWQDLENNDENVSSDDPNVNSTPDGNSTSREVAVRLSRNKSWSSMDLAAALAGDDPLGSIAARVANYRARRLQAATIATVRGVFADNAAAPTGTEHVQNDMTHDISGVSFVDGVTNFNTEAFIMAALTMGDSMDDLVGVMVHSVVFARMQTNNLIDFIPDARGEIQIPTFLGREVIVDDSMPRSGSVYETWLFGNAAVQLGQGNPLVPTEVDRKPAAGNGGGQEILYNRWEWTIHPTGHAYVGATSNDGGPTNTVLAQATSFQRVYPERKQIKLARLITREA